MRFLRRSLTGVFLFAVTFGLIFVAGFRMYSAIEERRSADTNERAARERIFAVNVITVEPGVLTPELVTYGEVRARRTLELRVPTGGTIVELADSFEEGGSVRAGDVLLRVDPTDADAALRVSQADFQEAEAEFADAERALVLAQDDLEAARAQLTLRSSALERQRNLADRGVGSVTNVEDAELSEAAARQSVLSKRQALASAEARVDQARTGVLRAQIALDEAKRAVNDTVVRAAFDGTLSDVSAALGGIVTANEQVGSLVDSSALEVSFRVSTEQYSRLLDDGGALIGLPVAVSLDVSGVDLRTTGRINRESAGVGEGQSGRLLFARLDSATGFRPGDFATVRIEEPELTGVARVPSAAVDAANTVLVVQDDMRLAVAPAPVLRRQGDDVIIEASTLAGQQIVAERSPLLGAGIRVRISGGSGAEAQTGTRAPSDMVTLTEDRRAKLVALVEGNNRMPAEAKERILAQLKAEQVPADMVAQLESRAGG